MSARFPSEIEAAMADAALRLGRALDFLEWPNAQRNAPPHEANALINLQGRLANLSPEYHFYSEGAIGTSGRVDLMASNGVTSLAIEAKRFGDINERSVSVSKDLERLREFKPDYYRGNGAGELNDWWATTQRWGLIIITSFRGDAVKEAWVTTNPDESHRWMEEYKGKDAPQTDGSGFAALWSVPDMYRFASPITLSDRWTTTSNGYFLCGAVPL